jgi:transposase
MRTKGSAEQLEARRLVGGRMLEQGYSVEEVADAVDVSQSSVRRWRNALRQGGMEALRAKPHSGKKPKLDPARHDELVQILLAGPQAAGYRNDLWTCARVTEVIERRFGVKYHPDHVWKLLHGLGWRCQQPEQRARERDEEAIRRWRKSDWLRIKKEHQTAS